MGASSYAHYRPAGKREETKFRYNPSETIEVEGGDREARAAERAGEEFSMKRFEGILILSFLLVTFSVRAQDAATTPKRMTNQDVISMTEAGLSEDVIIAKLRAASASGADATSFDTSVDGLKALKAANVSDAVIKVMINPAPAPTIVAAAAPMTIDPNLPPPEVGVYWKDGANFVLIPGQAITNAKVGGRAGSIFTDGLRNQHWDATLNGPTSNNRVRDHRAVFYIYVPEGASSSDYALVRLNKKSDRREFQIGSFGGITGGKSGVQKDKEIPIKAEHVGIRTYKVTLDQDLTPGEYGFFMGSGQSATMSGATGGNRSGGAASGRIYDFTVPE